jgi:chromosome segregation ATPase
LSLVEKHQAELATLRATSEKEQREALARARREFESQEAERAAALDAAKAKLIAAESAREAASAAKADAEAESNKLRARVASAEAESSKAKMTDVEARARVEALNAELASLRETLAASREAEAAARASSAAANEAHADTKVELQALHAALELGQRKASERCGKAEAAQQKAEAAQQKAQTELLALKGELAEFKARATQVAAALAEAEGRATAAEERAQQAGTERASWEVRARQVDANAAAEVDRLKNSLQAAQDARETAIEEQQTLERRLRDAQTRSQGLAEELLHAETRLSKLEAELGEQANTEALVQELEELQNQYQDQQYAHQEQLHDFAARLEAAVGRSARWEERCRQLQTRSNAEMAGTPPSGDPEAESRLRQATEHITALKDEVARLKRAAVQGTGEDEVARNVSAKQMSGLEKTVQSLQEKLAEAERRLAEQKSKAMGLEDALGMDDAGLKKKASHGGDSTSQKPGALAPIRSCCSMSICFFLFVDAPYAAHFGTRMSAFWNEDALFLHIYHGLICRSPRACPQCAEYKVELDRARFELDEMNKILASKNSERKDLRGRVQRLEQQLEEKDLVSFLRGGGC